MIIIRQHDKCDCGAACLSMIAAYYDLTISLASCKELTRKDNTGTNIHEIVEGAGKIGFTAVALSGTPSALFNGIQRREVSFPIIAHITNEGHVPHFIVLFSFQDGIFLVGDPAHGEIKMTESEFIEKWTGYIITFKKQNR